MKTLKKISTTMTKKMKTKLSLMMMKKNKEMKMTLMRKPTRKVIVLVIQKILILNIGRKTKDLLVFLIFV